MKKIAVFNHKGGVSKTTTAFNIGWKLAQMGKKVLLVDADSQCNLSLYALGRRCFDDFYSKGNKNNIKDALDPAFKSKPQLIQAVECIQIQNNKNLFLLPGHLDLSENEVQLGLSFQLTESIGALKNLPGAFNYLFDITAKKYEIDYVIIDMNPSLSSINQDLIISSDYFLVPTSPDLFSYMAVKSLANVLPAWERWAQKARMLFEDAEYPLPKTTPKFLGYTINDFNLSQGQPTQAFAELMDKISSITQSTLVPKLREVGMLMPDEQYAKAAELTKKLKSQKRPLNQYCIAEISNFNKLIALSNEKSVPIYELRLIGLQQGQQKTLTWFKMLFEIISQKIIVLTK